MTTLLASLLATGMTGAAMLFLLTDWPTTTALVLPPTRHTSPPAGPPSSPALPLLRHRTRGRRDPPRDRRARAPPPLQRVRPGGSRPTPNTHPSPTPPPSQPARPRRPQQPDQGTNPTDTSGPARGSTFTRWKGVNIRPLLTAVRPSVPASD